MGNSTTSHTSSPIVNHDAQIISTVAILCSLSVVALGLRLLSRRLRKMKLQLDDYLVLAAWVLMFLGLSERV